MDNIQKEYSDKAHELATLMGQFYPCEVVKGEDRTDYHVKMIVGDVEFKVHRDYNGVIQIQLYTYTYQSNVSSSTRVEVYKKHALDNMKVPTLKKVVAHINACTAIRDELDRLSKQASELHRMFLCDVDALNVPVKYHKDSNGNIDGGYIERNGILFEFEFSQDGYISKKVKVHYGVDNTLQAFMQLSENKYTK